MRIHVDIDPWAFACRVYLNGADISRWCKGADDEKSTVIVARDVRMLTPTERLCGPERTVTARSGAWEEEEWEVPVSGTLEIRGVDKAREDYLAYEDRRRVEAGRFQAPQ